MVSYNLRWLWKPILSQLEVHFTSAATTTIRLLFVIVMMLLYESNKGPKLCVADKRNHVSFEISPNVSLICFQNQYSRSLVLLILQAPGCALEVIYHKLLNLCFCYPHMLRMMITQIASK